MAPTIKPPPKPLRIAILEADHPMPQTTEKYGTYGNVHGALIKTAASSLGWDPSEQLYITKYDVERLQHFPSSLDDIDAIWITGSRANSFDNTPWIVQLVEYVRSLLTSQTRVKVIGICFGHQIIARALGVEVSRGTGWEASVFPVPLIGKGKELFGRDTLNIFQMHRDIVKTLPEGAENLGRTELCEFQGMYCKGRYVSVQGHPEFTEEIVAEILKVRKDAGIFTEAEYEDAVRRVGARHDGIVVAEAFLRFLMEE